MLQIEHEPHQEKKLFENSSAVFGPDCQGEHLQEGFPVLLDSCRDGSHSKKLTAGRWQAVNNNTLKFWILVLEKLHMGVGGLNPLSIQ